MKRTLTCIICPRGCQIDVEIEGKEIKSIEGYTCKRGLAYAESECTAPVRVLTTTAALDGGGVLAVKTDKAIPKEMLFECMKEINALVVPQTVKIGDIIVPDILGTGANLIAAANIK